MVRSRAKYRNCFFLKSKDSSSWMTGGKTERFSFLCVLVVVVQLLSLCPTLGNPMDGSMPGSSILYYLPEFAQIHVHWVGDIIQPSHLLLISSPFCLQSFPASGSFPVSQFFASGGQSIGVSASVLPMNIQGWFPLGLTGLISLLSKGLSRVFSSTIIWKHQFLDAQPSLWYSSHIHTWLLEKP